MWTGKKGLDSSLGSFPVSPRDLEKSPPLSTWAAPFLLVPKGSRIPWWLTVSFLLCLRLALLTTSQGLKAKGSVVHPGPRGQGPQGSRDALHTARGTEAGSEGQLIGY